MNRKRRLQGAITMKYQCIQRNMESKYKLLGKCIAKHPFLFSIVPIVISAFLSLGILRLTYIRDLEYLFTPMNGRAMADKNMIDRLFPMNSSENFDYLRVVNKIRFAAVLIVAEDGGTVLKKDVFNSAVLVDQIIHNVTVRWKGRDWKYEMICAKQNGSCLPMDVLSLKDKITDLNEGRYSIKFPAQLDSRTSRYTIYAVSLGGVDVDKESNVIEAKAIRLLYFLQNDNQEKDQLAVAWEAELMKSLERVKFDGVEVFRMVSSSLDTITTKNTALVFPFSPVSVILIFVFSVMSSMSKDWVRSKPWLAGAACASAGLSVAASFGFTMMCGIQYSDINIAVPFLILGIGVDDSFVLIAGWRRTNPKSNIETRMAESYSEAAVSITLTSITNFLSFGVGIMSPFAAVHIFCVYACISIVFAYLYQITFFGGCMVFSGWREEANRHCITFRKVKAAPIIQDVTTAEKQKTEDNNVPWCMFFFRDYVGAFLGRKDAKCLVIASLLCYIGLSIWGTIQLKVGLDYKVLFPYRSPEAEIMQYDFKYFTQYPDRIHVVVTKPIDYWNLAVQEKIDKMLRRLEDLKHTTNAEYTESWLRNYIDFTHHQHSWLFLRGYNTSIKEDFIEGLHIFLNIPWARRFKADIAFANNGTEIVASRFFVQSKDVTYGELQKEILLSTRHIVDSSELPVTVHSLWFPVYEHLSMIKSTALQSVGISALCVTIVTILFIPSVSSAIAITVAIASIQLGVVGFMSLWDVNLDMIAIIALVMSVGFSIDYSCHVCYAYLASEKTRSRDRIKDSLFAVGMPILQGSISTILGLTSLALSQSYAFSVVFKLVFLVIVFATLHGIFVLPVILSLLDFVFKTRKHEGVPTTLLTPNKEILVSNGVTCQTYAETNA